MANTRALLLGLLMFSLTSGCGHLVYASGPYRGRVIDAETKQPLAGAVVLAVWYREVPVAPHGPAVDYHDALEVLTDANGEFTIPERTHLTILGKIREPELIVYYPRYAPFPSLGAQPQAEALDAAYKKKLFPVELPLLKTREQRLRRAEIPAAVDHRIPPPKIEHLIRLINSERRELGLQPIDRRERFK